MKKNRRQKKIKIITTGGVASIFPRLCNKMSIISKDLL